MAQNGAQKRDSVTMRYVDRNQANESTPLLGEESTTFVEGNGLSSHTNTRERVEAQLRSCNGYIANIKRRYIPPKKGLLLLFFLYAFESFAFQNTTKGIRELFFQDNPDSGGIQEFMYSLMYTSIGRIFYPLAGILADSYLGRYKVIELGLWLLSCSLGTVCMALSLDSDYYLESPAIGVLTEYVFPIVALIFFALGTASFEVNAISFGADQLPQGCTSDQISSYFFWYDFTRNAGFAFGLILQILISLTPLYSNYRYLIISSIACFAVCLAICLHVIKHHWFFKNKRRDSPIRTIVSITWFSMTVKRHAPIRNRAFRYGEGKKSRFDLAKYQYDGKFDAEEVENVKTFFQISLVLISLYGYFISYAAIFSMLGEQFEATHSEDISPILLPYINELINCVTIVFFDPICNHLIIPISPMLTMSMKLRLFIGQCLNICALGIATFVQGVMVSKPDVYVWWLVFAAVIVALGETLTILACFEFIYAQAPEEMKGLLIGLMYLTFGISGGFSSVCSYLLTTNIDNEDNKIYLYVVFTVVAIIGLVGYCIVMYFYKNRQRPADDEEDLQRRLYASNVFGN